MQKGRQTRRISLVVLLGLTVAAISAPRKGRQENAAAQDKPATPAVNLSLRNDALTTLWEMRATSAQLEAMKKVVTECADDRVRAPGQVGPRVRETMQGLHDALVEAKDEELINSLQDQYDREVDTRNIDLDDDVKLTAAAKKHAADIFKMLSVRQVASLVASNEELLTDPRQDIENLLKKMKSIPADQWADERDSVADDAGMLLGGLDDTKVKQISNRVRQWLDQAHQLDNDAFTKKQAELIAAIPGVVGEVNAIQTIQNWGCREMATLLSNPELANALQERLK